MKVHHIVEADTGAWVARRVGKKILVIHSISGNIVPGGFKNGGSATRLANELNKAALGSSVTPAQTAAAAKASDVKVTPITPKKLSLLQRVAKVAGNSKNPVISKVGKTASKFGTAFNDAPKTAGLPGDKDIPKATGAIKKIRNGILRVFKSSVLGKAVSAMISLEQITYSLDGYLIEYQKAGCKSTPEVNYWRIKIADELMTAITAFFLAGVATAVALKATTAIAVTFFGFVPGAGWVAAALIGFIGIVGGGTLAYFLGKLAQNIPLMKGAADYVAITMLPPKLLNKVMKPVCENLTESQLNEALLHEQALYEENLKSIKSDLTRASLNMIKGDPKMMKIVKAAMKKDPKSDPRNG
tara:strand:+ start:131 stop:1201 length:1071 start_codon:yes stop_codon:yes gene_type:complete